MIAAMLSFFTTLWTLHNAGKKDRAFECMAVAAILTILLPLQKPLNLTNPVFYDSERVNYVQSMNQGLT